MKDVITINGINFLVKRSSRRKTISITVDRGNQVFIHAPAKTPDEYLEQITNRRSLWVYKKIQNKLAHPQWTLPREFIDGEGFFYFGRSYRLRIIPVQPNSKLPPLRLRGSWFELREDVRQNAPEHFRQWYKGQGLPWIERRVEFYSKRIGAKPTKIKIRQLGNRWASCGKKGNINFNWQIVCLPPSIIDYIIAHELIHLVRPNHNKEFWQLLEQAMPDYAKRKKWLDENSGQI